MEFLSVRYNLILDFEALLMGHGFAPKHTRRKGSNVLYLKASEQIRGSAHIHGSFRRRLWRS